MPQTTPQITPNVAPRDDTFEQTRARMMAERPDLFTVNSKFAPKLSFADRCCVLGFYKMGIEIGLLSIAFGLNRGTVRYIVRDSSRYYKNIRAKWLELGPNAFQRDFLDSDVGKEWWAKIQQSRGMEEVITETSIKKAAKLGAPNEKASTKEGRYNFHFPTANVSAVFSVKWINAFTGARNFDENSVERQPGWYVVYEGADWQALGTSPINGLVANSRTSNDALKGFMEQTGAEIE